MVGCVLKFFYSLCFALPPINPSEFSPSFLWGCRFVTRKVKAPLLFLFTLFPPNYHHGTIFFISFIRLSFFIIGVVNLLCFITSHLINLTSALPTQMLHLCFAHFPRGEQTRRASSWVYYDYTIIFSLYHGLAYIIICTSLVVLKVFPAKLERKVLANFCQFLYWDGSILCTIWVPNVPPPEFERGFSPIPISPCTEMGAHLRLRCQAVVGLGLLFWQESEEDFLLGIQDAGWEGSRNIVIILNPYLRALPSS